VIDAFFRIEQEILAIARRFQDDEDAEKAFGRELRVAAPPAQLASRSESVSA